MSRHKETIDFDSKRLAVDLAAKAPKWAAFQAKATSDDVAISYDKFKRAREGFATVETLAKIATVLGYPLERYIKSISGNILPTKEISGTWIALYLEAQRVNETVRTWERLHISQLDNKISGYYDFIKTDDKDSPGRSTVYLMKGRIVEDTIVGFYWVENRKSANGVGTFQLKMRPDCVLAEGYCSFYGHDGFVAASHNFWVRDDGTPESKYQLRIAEESILQNKIYHEIPAH